MNCRAVVSAGSIMASASMSWSRSSQCGDAARAYGAPAARDSEIAFRAHARSSGFSGKSGPNVTTIRVPVGCSAFATAPISVRPLFSGRSEISSIPADHSDRAAGRDDAADDDAQTVAERPTRR